VQAIGSIGAIAVSVAIVNHQTRSDRALEAKRRFEREATLPLTEILQSSEFYRALVDARNGLNLQPIGNPFMEYEISRFCAISKSVGQISLDGLSLNAARTVAEVVNEINTFNAFLNVSALGTQVSIKGALSGTVNFTIDQMSVFLQNLHSEYKSLTGEDALPTEKK